MEKFVIQGGAPLAGELTVAGNKNAALPILAACLLTEEELLLHRVPRIRDTEAQIALLERLGVEAAWIADNSLRLCAASVSELEVRNAWPRMSADSSTRNAGRARPPFNLVNAPDAHASRMAIRTSAGI